MQRRDFIKTTALSAIAISTSGFIRFDGQCYIGECETTSDILSPYYRPGNPERTNFQINGEKGDPIELTGKILQFVKSDPDDKGKKNWSFISR